MATTQKPTHKTKIANGYITVKLSHNNVARAPLPKVGDAPKLAHHMLDTLKIHGKQTILKLHQDLAPSYNLLEMADTMAIALALREAELVTVKYICQSRSWMIEATHMVEEIYSYQH